MIAPLPPCSANCPVNTDVPGYLAAIARGDYQKAARLIRANNTFASVCGWVCPHPCEDHCRRGQVDAPLSVRALKRFALEKAGGESLFPDKPTAQSLPYRVAIVGAGPAGLTAAWDLARAGYTVTVFERQPEAGGHLYASLPTYRLPRRVVREDVGRIAAAGVEIRTGVEIGKDVSLTDLQKEYDAVILAVGLSKSRSLNLPGFDHPDVLLALPFLQGTNLGRPVNIKKRVIVIGGGDVAMDVARTALRLGAQEVRVVCLETCDIMPAHPWEVKEAQEEGVELCAGWGPVRAVVEEGLVQGLEVKGVLSVFDEQGCFNPTFDEGRLSFVPGEMIIQAIGQCADLSCLADSPVAVNERGQLMVNRDTLETSVSGVFACGEVACGPGPAIAAVASGHRVAAAVRAYLEGVSLPAGNVATIGELPERVRTRLPSFARQEIPVLPADQRRYSFVVQELEFPPVQALREAERCLRCGLGAEVLKERCAACLTCQRVCPYGVPVVEGRANIPVEGCQGCGICAAACPAGAIVLKGLPGEEVHALLEGEKGRVGGVSSATDPPLAVFVCQRAYFQGLAPEVISSTPGLGQVRLVSLPTAGALDPLWLLKALDEGALGVAVITCGENNCRHVGGAARVKEQLKRFQKLLAELGYEPFRLQWHCLGAGGDPLAWLSEFARSLVQANKS
ncbi:FAD-dependent oxidoreductase [Desulfofundulus salinus]|uniref:FAD-dependent oxidoreductase n=1 Tax=Desulfofundulus salinus TaxID=2419843 RepID=A0A494WU16_9FIRM|nr:FAD-dependent oxidoreductase [Desulfofundulus salinum]RKO66303.1 FAD-dependent oxidoreductase [Desulfofundulus salinum]